MGRIPEAPPIIHRMRNAQVGELPPFFCEVRENQPTRAPETNGLGLLALAICVCPHVRALLDTTSTGAPASGPAALPGPAPEQPGRRPALRPQMPTLVAVSRSSLTCVCAESDLPALVRCDNFPPLWKSMCRTPKLNCRLRRSFRQIRRL